MTSREQGRLYSSLIKAVCSLFSGMRSPYTYQDHAFRIWVMYQLKSSMQIDTCTRTHSHICDVTNNNYLISIVARWISHPVLHITRCTHTQ